MASNSPSEAGYQPLPLQRYMLFGSDLTAYRKATNKLTEECVKRLGFNIQFPPVGPLSGADADLTVRRYSVVQSLQDAKTYGYHWQYDTPEVVAARDAATKFDQSLTAEEFVVIAGNQNETRQVGARGGCMGSADQQLTSGTSMSFADLTNSPLIRKVNMDPRATDSAATRAAMSKFAQCMTEAGYPDVKNPLDVPKQVSVDGAKTDYEIKAAITHFGCQQSSGVTIAMNQAEVAFQNKAIDSNPEGFAAIKAGIDAMVRRATEVVAGG